MSIKAVSSQRIAEIIQELFYSEFGSKVRGRFQISREQLKLLSGVSRLHERRVEYIRILLLELELLMISHGENFFIIEASKVEAWRKLSQQAIRSQLRVLQKEEANKQKKKIKALKASDIKINSLNFSQEVDSEYVFEKLTSPEVCSNFQENEDVSNFLFEDGCVIEYIDWVFNDGELEADGYCDVVSKNRDSKTIFGLFELGGDAREWDVKFDKVVNGIKFSRIILLFENEQWFIRTDLYSKNEVSGDQKYEFEIVSQTDSEIVWEDENTVLTVKFRKETNTIV
jgi:hypothetical protein